MYTTPRWRPLLVTGLVGHVGAARKTKVPRVVCGGAARSGEVRTTGWLWHLMRTASWRGILMAHTHQDYRMTVACNAHRILVGWLLRLRSQPAPSC